MIKSDNFEQIIPDLIEVQSEVEGIERDKTAEVRTSNGKYSYDYTSLQKLTKTVRCELNDRGLFLTHTIKSINDVPHLETLVIGEDGEYVGSCARLMIDTHDPQDFGASVTYARRYTLSSLLGIPSEEDDDANRSSGGGKMKSKSGGGSGGQNLSDKAGSITDAQRDAIYGIASDAEIEVDGETYSGKDEIIERIKGNYEVDSVNDLSKSQASTTIDRLTKLTD